MSENPTTEDTQWRSTLSPEAYKALREGHMEEPGSGRYVRTKYVGTYVCGGCGTALFHTDDQIDDGSGFAAFRAPFANNAISETRHYGVDGSEVTSACCTACGGRVGVIEEIGLRSADDLEMGNRQRTYHVSSNAVVLKPPFTPRNYPIQYVFIIGSLVVAGLGVYVLTHGLLHVAKNEQISSEVLLYVDQNEIEAHTLVVTLPGKVIITPSSFGSSTALLVVFGSMKDRGLSIRGLPDTALLVWLDRSFHIVESTRLNAQAPALEDNGTVVYALIVTEQRLIDALANRPPGFELTVVNSLQLL